ncbi:MAG TPA: ATP-binding protein [Gammaproteobacteria bacterium]|nr:ATP-binding protein [Gammaproteobacteria bacterium]
MSLRFQLLALGAITLLLPWAGLEMVRQVEVSLRRALEQSLLDRARASIVVTRLAESNALRRRDSREPSLGEPVYAHSLSQPPLLDGLRGDWIFSRDPSGESAEARALTFDGGSRLWLGFNSTFLYLFADVADDEIVYQRTPGDMPHGDRIALLPADDGGDVLPLLLANSAQGPFSAQLTAGAPRFDSSGGYYDIVRGYWRETAAGFSVEARLPLRIAEAALGVGVIDSDDGGATARIAAATWGDAQAPNALVRESPELNVVLRPFAGGDSRLRVLDSDGFVLADSGPLAPADVSDAAASPSILERVFRYVLRRDDPDYAGQESRPGQIGDPTLRAALGGEAATAWYRQGAAVSAIVAAAVPIDPENPRLGAVVLEQTSDPIVTVANQAMMRVMATAVGVIFIVALAAFGYASILSFRVGRLARAAESALGPRGEINVRLPGTKGRDEIGDLSRSFGDLLGRLRDYTEYLQSLKSKLSHELRTPLAIVATSLDNLEHELATEPAKDYLARLRHGTERLEAILQAMTAATRVEQAITETRLERFDAAAVVSSCMNAYRDVYKDRKFGVTLPAEPVVIDGSGELIEQMLDKLIDNAAGFAREGSTIEVSLETRAGDAVLAVVNRGPLLPEAMRHRLFDSLVSVRESEGDKPHLGLGLYIVTLVAEFHGGTVGAENLADGSGVRISVVLPRA